MSEDKLADTGSFFVFVPAEEEPVTEPTSSESASCEAPEQGIVPTDTAGQPE